MNVEKPTKRARMAGAVAGALIGIVPVAAGLVASGTELLVVAGILGGITGGLLGARFGPGVRQRSRRSAAAVVLRMSVLAVLLGDLLVTGFFALVALSSSNPGSVVFAVTVFPVLGFAIFGIPAFGMALVAGLVWVVVMRAVPARWVGDPA
jgi:hypothetical protein